MQSVVQLKSLQDFKDAAYVLLEPFNGLPCNLMIAGGSLINCLDDKRIDSLDSTRWSVYFADERCEENHTNFSTAKVFLDRLKGTIHRMTLTGHPEADAQRYEEILSQVGKIDLCLLGVGENGHICSLWPEAPVLDSSRLVEAVEVDTSISPSRLTVTPKFLNETVKSLFFLLPPRDGEPKAVLVPAESILKRLRVPFIVFASRAVCGCSCGK